MEFFMSPDTSSCAPAQPPHPPRPPHVATGDDEGDDGETYPIAIGLRRNRLNGQFSRKLEGDPQPTLFQMN
jgi:hypothetical protein